MKRIITITLFLIFAFSLLAAGFIQVRNFTRTQYGGGPQNWTAVQDSFGRLYVGNRDGMLCHDGERWVKYLLPNLTPVRAILYDKATDRLYAGGTEEFGYFAPDSLAGELKFTSLTPTIDRSGVRFTEVWNIMMADGRIYFQTDNHIMRFNGSKTHPIAVPGRISCSAFVNNNVYVGTENGSMGRIVGDRFVPLPGCDVLAGKKIKAILPGTGGILIATPVDGLFTHDGKRAKPLESDINAFLKENQLFCATASGPDYVFGTVANGAVVKNLSTGRTRYINKQSGLQNNTVLNAAFDKSGNIWLCLDNGLDYAIYNSPVTNLIGASNDVGAGYTSHRDGNTIYFGTNQGLYSAPYPIPSSPEPLALSRRLPGQIWTTSAAPGGFFVAGDAGAFSAAAGVFTRIEGIPGTYRIRLLPERHDAAIASTYDGFYLLECRSGRWAAASKIANDHDVRGDFNIDSERNIWVSHWQKGVFRLHLADSLSNFESCTLFNHANGLTTSTDNSVAVIDGSPVITNRSGFFTPADGGNAFSSDDEMNRRFNASELISLHPVGGESLVLISHYGITVALADSNGAFTTRFTPMKSLIDDLVNGYEHVNMLSPSEIIVANQNGFWSHNPEFAPASNWKPRPFVSAVYANADSLVYRPAASDTDAEISLPYDLNTLRIELACPDFHSEGSVHYSSYLENYDSDWNSPTVEPVREYTRLAEGDYTLRVRATNLQSGETAETSFRFRISPPWYRSTVAKLIYLAIILLLIGSLFLGANRWKANAEKRMEDRKEEELDAMRRRAEREALQKDYEIATLKSEQLEVDIKHKSDELSSATMNLIRKNEILHEIASKIAKIQSETSLGQSVQKQLSHLQTSIEQNISHDDDWATFNRNFDIVYGDYTKRLHEKHPQLTTSDIRLCCYIKMGLSSKEIAPLINISFKSVEMARYRMRKKMDLGADIGLTEYLANF